MLDLQSSNTVEYHLQGLYSGEQVFWVIVGIQQFVTQDVKKVEFCIGSSLSKDA